jgi:hypothetical protein
MAQFEDFEELKGHMVRLEPADADEARLEMLDEDDLAAFGKVRRALYGEVAALTRDEVHRFLKVRVELKLSIVAILFCPPPDPGPGHGPGGGHGPAGGGGGQGGPGLQYHRERYSTGAGGRFAALGE